MLLKFPLVLAYLALGNADRKIRKINKSNLYDAAMYDLPIVDKSNLPEDDIMDTYFLNLAAALRRQLKVCAAIRDKICGKYSI